MTPRIAAATEACRRTGMGLTPRQRELLVYLSERDHCPTYAEMRDALGLKSASCAWQLAKALEERGYISRRSNRWQGIEVLNPLQRTPPVNTSPLIYRPIFIHGERYCFLSDELRQSLYASGASRAGSAASPSPGAAHDAGEERAGVCSSPVGS